MIAAELIRRATEAGIKMAVGPDGRLLLRAERQPPADLLADLAAHKGELLVELAAANDLLSSSVSSAPGLPYCRKAGTWSCTT